ncbi:MAG: hypothetical protein FWD68_13885 [Alphaproteobacteria bacterium]|nr:hypothetical protein [Alphaproteobacteria bacterium]
MTATTAIRQAPKASAISILPHCPICSDTMVAAEASVLSADLVVSHLWSCDTCGCGFVTRHPQRRKAHRGAMSPRAQSAQVHL